MSGPFFSVKTAPPPRDLLHVQSGAGPAGRVPAQLLRQRPGGVGDAQLQVLVGAAGRAAGGGPVRENQYERTSTRRPVREDHAGRQHRGGGAPGERWSAVQQRGESAGHKS